MISPHDDPAPQPTRLLLLISPLLILLGLVLGLALLVSRHGRRPDGPTPGPSSASPEGYLFSSWNVENLYDDRDDPQDHDPLEDWFAARPEMLRLKHDLLVHALLRLNRGRGPDILAIVEVENRRAVELLRQALNARLPSALHYTGLAHRDNLTGRRIEPALLTRLPLRGEGLGAILDAFQPRGGKRDRAEGRDFGGRRILEVQVMSEGGPLTVIVSHWTSRLTDDTGVKRESYADVLYRAVLDLLAHDPVADVILAGDFNDTPSDPSLTEHLRATGNSSLVRAGDRRPRLLNLMAGRDPRRFGTYFYRGRWQILDHIVCSPGLLDGVGWSVDPDTIEVVGDYRLRSNTDRRPLRFGGPDHKGPRGPSDHFAVAVRLRVRGSQAAQ